MEAYTYMNNCILFLFFSLRTTTENIWFIEYEAGQYLKSVQS